MATSDTRVADILPSFSNNMSDFRLMSSTVFMNTIKSRLRRSDSVYAENVM
jgi:hypothetical protein